MISEQSLFDLYRSYIGEPDSERDVYVGFGLFLCGIILAVVALGLFLWSSRFDRSAGSMYFTWALPAYALAMLSLPSMMLGIVVLLPSERKVLAVSSLGVVITIVATAGFVVAYPENWNFMGSGEDYTIEVTATYAVGLSAITASTGAALIAHYLDLARQVEVVREDEEEKEHYTDEEIESDIDEAMDGVELSWGGVEKSDNTTLTFTDHEFTDAEIGEAGVTKTRSKGVQSQVAGLKGMKGGEAKTQTVGQTVDDQTAKLKELREQKLAEETATAEKGVVGRARGRVGGAVGRGRDRVGRSVARTRSRVTGAAGRVKAKALDVRRRIGRN